MNALKVQMAVLNYVQTPLAATYALVIQAIVYKAMDKHAMVNQLKVPVFS